MTEASTPLMRQYTAIKKQHPNSLLFFRLGDFYELFFEDAVVASKELQITLTARSKEKGIHVPMCGVPYHAAEGYIAKLIRKGYKVAICDQGEDPKLAKKLVCRACPLDRRIPRHRVPGRRRGPSHPGRTSDAPSARTALCFLPAAVSSIAPGVAPAGSRSTHYGEARQRPRVYECWLNC